MPRKRTKDLDLPPRLRLKSGTYYYDHGPGPDGRRIWEKLGKSRSQAKKRWGQIESERSAPPSGETVAAMIHYYRRKHLHGLAPRTQHDRNLILDRLEKVFGPMRPAAVTPQHIAQYLEQHPSATAANRDITVLSVVFKKGMRASMATSNPCQGVEKNSEKARDRYIEDWEFAAVKASAEDWMQAVMDLAYATGMRLGDLLKLRWSDVTEDGLAFRSGKTGQRQVMEITPELEDTLARLKRARPVSGMVVVCTRKGQPYSPTGFSQIFARRVKRAIKNKVLLEPFTFHDIRAKSATDYEEQGGDPQALLGHTTRQQTETYLRSKKTIKVQPVKAKKPST